MKLYHQGDLVLKSVAKLPKKATKKVEPVLAYGEITGHSHRFEPHLASVYEAGDKTYVEVLKDAVLHHEEHKGAWLLTADMGYIRQQPDFIIEKGIYEIEHEREYSVFDEEIKKVMD